MFKKFLRWVIDIVVIIVASSIYSLGVHSFTAPNEIAPGGVTGIVTILNYLFGVPIGTMVSIVNIPLIIVGFIFLGKRIMIKTVISVAVFTLTTDYLFNSIPVYEGDMILASIFGGAFMGIGLGLVYMREATTGGMDIVNKLIQKAIPHVKLGQITFTTDVIVITIAIFAYGNFEAGLYAVISMFVLSRCIDSLIYGSNEAKMLMIISDEYEAISEKILKSNRGVTIIKGTGAYSKTERNIIFCAVPKNEYFRIKRIVKTIDPKAFIIITSAGEVLGEGFASNNN